MTVTDTLPALGKLTARRVEVVQETMQPERVSLWLKDFNAKKRP
jgi:hypothetical protein